MSTVKYAIAIGTVDRSPMANYLQGTLAALARSKAVYACGFDVAIDIIDGKGRTRNENGLACLDAALDRSPMWVLFLEDDLIFCRDFLGSIDRWLTVHAALPAAGPRIYTFYTPLADVGRLYERSVAGRLTVNGGALDAIPLPVGVWSHCQAIALRAADAAAARDWIRNRLPTWGSPRGFDRLLRQWGLSTWANQRGVIASVPSFVQHVGRDSICGSRWHESPCFGGVDWSYSPPVLSSHAGGADVHGIRS